MNNDLNERRNAKKRLTLSPRDIHVGWIAGAGVSMVIFLLATFATAYRHDVYSSSLGLRDLVSTDVWFRVFLALTCFSLLLFLGLLVYAFIAGRIGGSSDNEEQELLSTAKTTEVKEEAPAIEEKAHATERRERVIINEAKLRDIFDSKFMHEWAGDGKMYLDQAIEDLQFVLDNYVKGSKQDEAHFASKHVIKIAMSFIRISTSGRFIILSLNGAAYCSIVYPLSCPSERTSRNFEYFPTRSRSASTTFSKK